MNDTILQLAARPIAPPPGPRRRMQHRLRTASRGIADLYKRLAEAPPESIASSRAAEWLLDNYHIVQRAVRSLREEFPSNFERRLPTLVDGELARAPLAYALALEILQRANNHLDIDGLTGAVRDFQRVRYLTIAEVWALPALLRLAVLERLAHTAGALRVPHPGTDDAEGGHTARGGSDESHAPIVANCVRSLRMLETANWKEFFESVSETERALREDPASVYAQMDFETRDQYRKVIEAVALGTHSPEDAAAWEVIRLARAGSTPRTQHVGYYLVDQGFDRLAHDLGYRARGKRRLRQLLTQHPTPVYLGFISTFTVAALAGVAALLTAHDASFLLTFIGVAAGLIPASTIAVSLTNGFMTRLLPPRVLAKMDFGDGIPAACQTAVAVPALLIDTAEIDSLVHALEIRFLANQDPHLHFMLLTDYCDAELPSMPEDAELLRYASDRLRGLNAKYGGEGAAPFHLLHRPRQWCLTEGCWSGWERKRGKLSAFNRLLTGRQAHEFSTHIGDPTVFASIRYVIVLDADTELPRGAARRLIATLAHPLNHAGFDPETGVVVAGYTILQPRVEISPRSAEATWFSRLFSGDTGLDPYTHAVSDVYQDLFGEGLYVGKGIYDVAAFERSLAGRIPDGTLLSHDLFEGIHGRAGLVTDVVLIEDYPAQYLAYTRRLHRWARGDWQLLPWLAGWVPLGKETAPNRLAPIARWKIIDNLRRSLLVPALLSFLILAWLTFPGPALGWTVLALLVLAVPGLTDLTGHLVSTKWTDVSLSLTSALRNLKSAAAFWCFEIIFLAHQAVALCDAILRTLFRVYVTRRHLLQWTTAAHTARRLARQGAHRPVWREMVGAPAIAVVTALVLALFRPAALPAAAPLLLLWLLSPELALFISRPRTRPAYIPSASETRHLRVLARRTWAFFETFVGPDDQWLAPDHFQEDPRGIVARRTSPTNTGMLHLATISAYDMGYRGLLWTALRVKNTLDTMDRMERYRGHFLNWYDTSDLQPLAPRYVSTVDSGNLVGCLLVVKQSSRELAASRVMRATEWDGLDDTLAVLHEVIESAAEHDATVLEPLRLHIEGMHAHVQRVRTAPREWPAALAALLGESCPALERDLRDLVGATTGRLDGRVLSELQLWSVLVRRHAERMRREMDLVAPWLSALTRLPPRLNDAVAPHEGAAIRAQLLALPTLPRLGEVAALCATINAHLTRLHELATTEDPHSTAAAEVHAWCDAFANGLGVAQQSVRYVTDTLRDNERRADALVQETDFSLLYDTRRRLFHIGYNVTASRLDDNHYDLLASEARLASFIAIAKGDVPEKHWLHLGRAVGKVGGTKALLSWSGTMFEYLMPSLMLREAPNSLMGLSCYAAVREQIAYGRQRGVPWGISESSYYRFDNTQTYQYRAFGVPSLGYKRGLEDDLTIAPYATPLALRFDTQASLANLEALRDHGLVGRYGLYEAIDFTPRRLPPGQRSAIVRTFMAHHQGMIFAALNNFINGDPLVRRFHAEPFAETAETLLWERPAARLPIEQTRPTAGAPVVHSARPHRPTLDAWPAQPNAAFPQAHVLSNGRYSVVVTAAGGGFSRWRDLALTAWAPDSTLDDAGFRIYVSDVDAPDKWVTFRPGMSPEARAVTFHPHMVEVHAQYLGVSIRERIAVAPDADMEIHHLTLTNEGNQPRRIRVTSYAEVVLGEAAAARRHPAFSKMFVETEYVHEQHALVFHRRPRAPEERRAYLVHMMVLPPTGAHPSGHETARDQFLGRGRTPRSPAAMQPHAHLSGTTGTPLDPIMALAADIELAPHATQQVAFATLVDVSRSAALELATRHHSLSQLDWMLELAESHCETELAQLNVRPRQLPAFQQLLSLLLYPHQALRAPADVLARNSHGQSALWKHAISGDLPILVVRVADPENTALVYEVLRAQAFWRGRGVAIDLVLLSERASGYVAEMNDRLVQTVASVGVEAWLHRPGGMFLLHADQLAEDDRTVLMAAARVLLDSAGGTLAKQLERLQPDPVHLPPLVHTAAPTLSPRTVDRPAGLVCDNGFGGFSEDGREYVIHLEPGESTPAPWVNVVANSQFGFLISESGGGYTWAHNSGENRLTPWGNDPVADEPGEAVYLRDEETGEVWSPTPAPARGPGAYQVRHAAGHTSFQHCSHELGQQLTVFAAVERPIKFTQLEVTNDSDRPRRVTVTYYVEWVLGTTREVCEPYVIAEFDADSQTILARNPWNEIFADAVAFVAASEKLHGFTGDRTEFLGRHGNKALPDALARIGLANTVRPGLDPCAAVQVHLDFQPGETKTIHFLLGQGRDRDEALGLVRAYRSAAAVTSAFADVEGHWDSILDARTVRTPDPGLDIMLNRWLLYQTLASRLWARTGFYQSSGAFGFRDQLQDVMALLHVRPELSRAHIVEAARHQFSEGDVLHWWHPPSGAGIRTRCSDDLLWLPFVTAHYIAVTGDSSILTEPVPFLVAQPLRVNEHERYARFEPDVHAAAHTLYEHCMRAIDQGRTVGSHGLPLFGAGDWNDGMNRVGILGRGESVWLGWFLYATLERFAVVCESQGDSTEADDLRNEARRLRGAIESSGWDGQWYRRGYYDDGSPLGSAELDEGRIDSIAQSWSVLSAGGNADRARQAMDALRRNLIRDGDGLILLLAPPFDGMHQQPGYISAYPPGVRENGGQYTHAAVWAIWAFAELGQGDRAAELFQRLLPIGRADTRARAARYRVEPYVLAADVYGAAPHTGRGGWTWYTGAAGWAYRFGWEALLGIRQNAEGWRIEPSIPLDWPGVDVTLRDGATTFEIHVDNSRGVGRGVERLVVDGTSQTEPFLPRLNDGCVHRVEVVLGVPTEVARSSAIAV